MDNQRLPNMRIGIITGIIENKCTKQYLDLSVIKNL